MSTHHEILKEISKVIPKYIKKIEVNFDIITLTLKKPEDLTTLLLFFKNYSNTQFKTLIDITAVDYIGDAQRFEIIYILLSVSFNKRIILKILSNEKTPIPSATTIFSNANWLEREVWDMFGIFFFNHSDLRRLLTDYGFEGHPLKKDFPLSGYTEVRYDETKKQVISEPIEVTQEFRQFDCSSPWEK
uniref:NADH dehydrogenase subunit 9 n=1 Tax=Cyanoptyche gloeocystis TaxID=77922 RepID=A0A096Y6W8_9EUKA|nr:NADH dehydrogenase subunit 9 [Cyanoptyche gloeocystis]AIM52062.1 NADH dehydrogenase subunit 9 [Cyanoptyche gloeocystis]